MAILWPAAICPLCNAPLGNLSDVVATSHFIADSTDPLMPYSDVGMHKHCFLQWPKREEFIERHNEVLWSDHAGIAYVMRGDGSIEHVAAGPTLPIHKRRETSQAAAMSERRPGVFLGIFHDYKAWSFTLVLSVRSEFSHTESCALGRTRIRVSALSRYKDVAAGAAGIGFQPRTASVAPDRIEFEIDRSTPDFALVLRENVIVVAIPPDAGLSDPHLRAVHRAEQ